MSMITDGNSQTLCRTATLNACDIPRVLSKTTNQSAMAATPHSAENPSARIHSCRVY